ncbi:hypothetical protein BYT27DRAFT_6516062 [Phlegmacium glaucopus]|nr:hypothetical protein BYT27DRAFT_6516062 [Phlegmacium glaucopus]
MLLSCMGYLLILGQQTGPLPDHNVCLFQAMLVYASPALNALSFVALTLEIFLALSGKTCGSRTKMMVLFFVPYGVFIGILIEVLILGLLNPDAVVRGRNGFICGISIRVPIILTVAIVICAMIAFIILGGRIAVQCRRRCRSGCQILSTHNSVPFALVLRVAFFGIFSILTIGFTIIFMFSAFHVYSDLSLAVLHLTVGIVFGSQKDILSVWMFWRKLPDTLPTSTTATETTNSKDSTIETQP